MSGPLTTNATVSGSRRLDDNTVASVYDTREVKIQDALKDVELITPMGGKIQRFMVDTDISDWRVGDDVTLLRHGQATAFDVATYQITGSRIVGGLGLERKRMVIEGGR